MLVLAVVLSWTTIHTPVNSPLPNTACPVHLNSELLWTWWIHGTSHSDLWLINTSASSEKGSEHKNVTESFTCDRFYNLDYKVNSCGYSNIHSITTLQSHLNCNFKSMLYLAKQNLMQVLNWSAFVAYAAPCWQPEFRDARSLRCSHLWVIINSFTRSMRELPRSSWGWTLSSGGALPGFLVWTSILRSVCVHHWK